MESHGTPQTSPEILHVFEMLKLTTPEQREAFLRFQDFHTYPPTIPEQTFTTFLTHNTGLLESSEVGYAKLESASQ